MSRADVKQSRQTLRRIDAHLRQAHQHLGAQVETVSYVDVIYHPNSALPMLNYVTPRQKTAWVSGSHIEKGLDLLRDKGRSSRVRFADGLYPPVFGRSLLELGLQAEAEIPVMVYRAGEQPRPLASLPSDTAVSRVTDQQGMAIWWYVWRNAFYNVAASGVEPILLGHDMRELHSGRQIDLILYRHRFPVGVARLTIYETSAHLLAQAILSEARTSTLQKQLHTAALNAALDAGCDFVFAAGEDADERALFREIGFVDSGSIVSYAEPQSSSETQGEAEDSPTPPVLVI